MHAILRAIRVTTLFFILLAPVPLVAAVTAEKTPNDAYDQLQQLADDVREPPKQEWRGTLAS